MSGRGGGRGAYFKAKYGGGGRGGRGGDGGGGGGGGGGTAQQLQDTLHRLDGKGYKAYKDIEGQWTFAGFTLIVDHAQSDPFAHPSRCRVQLSMATAGFPAEAYSTPIRRTALCDYLTRAFAHHVAASGADQRTEGGGWSGAKGGELTIDSPGQHVLERTSVLVTKDTVEARFTVALPAQGRSVLGTWAAQVLVEQLPRFVQASLLYRSLDARRLQLHLATVEDAAHLRAALRPAGLIAFVADGSILPRQSGACDLPMSSAEAVPFSAPASLAAEFTLPNRGAVRGMGVPRGVTVIVGGGFHGKSTLLQAVEVGVYNHVPGDGRELVVTDADAVKIRAEDGRCVEAVDISPFISNLPFGKATNIQEALELGCSSLIIDEDTAATNFMIRDARMQTLVAKEKEPITPFISKVRALYQQHGVSSLLVIGGSGDYFDVADKVVMMESFAPRDVTDEAIAIGRRFATPEADAMAAAAAAAPFGSVAQRVVACVCDAPVEKVATRTKAVVSFGDTELDLAFVEQLVEKSQTRSIADSLLLMKKQLVNGERSVAQLIMQLEQLWDTRGLDALAPAMHFGHYARPRRFELAAALNRLRCMRVR